MPTVEVPAQLTVEHLMTAVRQLSPAEWREFKQQLEEWQAQKGDSRKPEAELLDAIQSRLSPKDERRLKRLITKSEFGTLTSMELAEYQSLVQHAERLDVERVEALGELARRRGKPARILMQELGWKSGTPDT